MYDAPVPIRKSGLILTRAFSDWLDGEVISSGEGVNAVLNNYDLATEGIRGGAEHPNNFAAQKSAGHLNRLPIWWTGFAETPLDDKDYDYVTARIGFAALMEVSGGWRIQCYLKSKTATEYLRRRNAKPAGIPIQKAVTDRLWQLLPDSGNFAEADLSFRDLHEQTKKVANLSELAIKTMCHEAQDFAQQTRVRYKNVPIQQMLGNQYNWLTLAVDSVVLAAKDRGGDLAAVPFLEPRSISEESGKTHYPLAAPVNWAEVLAA